MSDCLNTLAPRALRSVTQEDLHPSLEMIAATLCDSELVADAHFLLVGEACSEVGVVVVPSARGWALVDAQSRRAYEEILRDILAAAGKTGVSPTRFRLMWALPRDAPGSAADTAARALFDPRRPYVRMTDQQRDCVTLAVEIDPASPYFEGHFDQAAVLAGVVQVEWAVRLGRELFGVGDGFRCMEALKFQKVIRPGDAVKLVLEWNRERTTLSFGFSSQAGRHSSGRIVFGGVP